MLLNVFNLYYVSLLITKNELFEIIKTSKYL
jgi:hypothetical protein